MARAGIAVLVLLLALAGWWLLAPDEQHAPSAAPGASTPRDEQVIAVPAADVPLVTRTNAPDAPATQPPVPTQAIWLDVLVVDKLTSRPVAGATAVWCDETQDAMVAGLPQAEQEALHRDGEDMARRFGWHGHSNREGRLRIHLGKTSTTVFVRAGTRYGMGHFDQGQDPPPEGHRILVEDDVTVRVRVLDALERPAARVPVLLEPFDPDTREPVLTGNHLDSDHQGIATFTHLQALQTFPSGKHRGKRVAHWVVRLVIPHVALEPVLVDAQAPPAEPVELRLPASGRLKMRATFAGEVPQERTSFALGGGPHPWLVQPDADRWTRFGHVPLGKLWSVSAWIGGGFWQFELTGPTVQDQEVAASFELDHVVALTGRILDEDGTPLGGQMVMAAFDATFTSGDSTVPTGADGRFLWLLGRHVPDPKSAPKLQWLAFERRMPGSKPLRVIVPPRDLVPGRNELGDLRLGVDALVVSGRISFDKPGHVPTWLQIQRHGEAKGRSGVPTAKWDQVGGLQTDIQEDGSFEVRGALEPGRYRILVPPLNSLPVEPVEFTPGATDVLIAFRRGSTLTATCRVPAGLETRLQLRLQPRDVPSATGAERFANHRNPLVGRIVEPHGELTQYRWSILESGTYTLLVEGRGFPEPFLTIDDVVVPAAEGGDPRLRDCDLRPSIDALRVRLHATGLQERECCLFPQPQAEDRDWSGFAISTGETVLPLPKRPVDLLFAAPGMRPVRVRGARGQVEVTLENWLTVELRFPGTNALPPGAKLLVSASDRPPGPPPRRNTRYLTDGGSGTLEQLLQPPPVASEVKDGMATVTIGEGATSLWIFLQLGNRGAVLRQVSPAVVIAGGPVTVQLSADEIRTTLESLQRAAKK